MCPPLPGQDGRATSTLFAGAPNSWSPELPCKKLSYPPRCDSHAVRKRSHMRRPWVGSILGSPSLEILLESARLMSEQAFR